ncbi:MAG: hypothetical protein U9O97_05620 [Elusimicrobiota bacterium]|nr:hypothetical protein [Elusimicrobiota bacterium]
MLEKRAVSPDVLIVDDDVNLIPCFKCFMEENYPLLTVDFALNGFEAGIKLSRSVPPLSLPYFFTELKMAEIKCSMFTRLFLWKPPKK